MKFFVMVSFILIVIIAGVGCASNNESSPSEGYIFQMEGNRVLILDNVKEEDIGKTWNEIFEHYQGRAIWLKTSNAASLKVGQKVRYWVDGPVAESFPEQASAKKIEVISVK